MELVTEIVQALAPWRQGLTVVAVATSIAKVFEWLEPVLNDEGRKTLSEWLNDIRTDQQYESWIATLATLIDKVFGTKPISWEFVTRSLVSTLIALVTVALIDFGWRAWVGPMNHVWYVFYVLYWILTRGVIANVLPDYVSLLVSRGIVRRMVHARGAVAVASWLVIDTLITGVIASVSVLWLCSVGSGARSHRSSHSRIRSRHSSVSLGYTHTKWVRQSRILP